MDNEHGLSQPLLPSYSTTTTAQTTIIQLQPDVESSALLRFLLIISLGLISIWASYEASKGFDITAVNDAGDTAAGKHLTLFYVSNDKALRILQNASDMVQTILFTNDSKPLVPLGHVTLRLGYHDLAGMDMVNVENNGNCQFTINVSISAMNIGGSDDQGVIWAIQRGMARVWLLNSECYSKAPSWVVDSLVEYVSSVGGFGTSWEWPEFLDYCERQGIQQLVDGRIDQTVNEALKKACEAHI